MQTAMINIDSISQKFYETFNITKEEVEKIVKGRSGRKKGWILALQSSYTALKGEYLFPKDLINEILATLKSDRAKLEYSEYIDWEYDIRHVLLHRILNYQMYLDSDVINLENLCKHWTDLSEIYNFKNVDQDLKNFLEKKFENLFASIEKAEAESIKRVKEIKGLSNACRDFIKQKNINIILFDIFLNESDEVLKTCIKRITRVKTSIGSSVGYEFEDIQHDKEAYFEAMESFTVRFNYELPK